MSAIPFPGSDILEQVESLKNAGFSEEQAKAQIKAMQGMLRAYDEASRKQLATKGDILDLRLEIEKARNSVLTWMIALMVALAGVLIAAMSYFRA